MAADLIIVATLLLSGVLAMVRGFTHELLSIIAFTAAALIALFLLPVLKPIIGDHVPHGWAGTAMIVAFTFFLALIPLWYIGERVGQTVRKSKVGIVDRAVGFGFGGLRGLFILAIAYILLSNFAGTERNMPQWIVNARLLPLVKSSADLLLAVLPAETPLKPST